MSQFVQLNRYRAAWDHLQAVQAKLTETTDPAQIQQIQEEITEVYTEFRNAQFNFYTLLVITLDEHAERLERVERVVQEAREELRSALRERFAPLLTEETGREGA